MHVDGAPAETDHADQLEQLGYHQLLFQDTTSAGFQSRPDIVAEYLYYLILMQYCHKCYGSIYAAVQYYNWIQIH